MPVSDKTKHATILNKKRDNFSTYIIIKMVKRKENILLYFSETMSSGQRTRFSFITVDTALIGGTII